MQDEWELRTSSLRLKADKNRSDFLQRPRLSVDSRGSDDELHALI